MRAFIFWGCAGAPWDSPHENYLVQENPSGPWVIDGCGVEREKTFSTPDEGLRYYRDCEEKLMGHPRRDLDDPEVGIFPEMRELDPEEYRKVQDRR